MAEEITVEIKDSGWSSWYQKTRKEMTFTERSQSAMFGIFATVATQAQDYAKKNFKWTPRSGRAHTGLNAGVRAMNNDEIELWVAHGVEYGIYLELAMQKKYAILVPTINYIRPILFEEVLKFLKALGKGR